MKEERRDPTVQADDSHLDQEAVNRLRSYVPPPTAYDQVPLSRRAAVLLLLYADRNGDLRVVITIRAKTLSSCMFWLDQPCSQGLVAVLHDMRTALTLA